MLASFNVTPASERVNNTSTVKEVSEELGYML
jgi:hypothetical protein